MESGFRMNHVAVRKVNLKFNEKGEDCDCGVTFNECKLFIVPEYVVSVKNLGDCFEVQIDNGSWKVVRASLLDHPQRFSIKTNIDGTHSKFSAVISPEQIAVFTEVRPRHFPLIITTISIRQTNFLNS